MTSADRYLFARSLPGISTEIYFPKKAAYQGAIFDALRKGFFVERVREYLRLHVPHLLDEFRHEWPGLLDPARYGLPVDLPAEASAETRARYRVDQYESVFHGYSVYSVDGVYFDPHSQAEFEEATQIIRIVFRAPVAPGDPSPAASIRLPLARWLIQQAAPSDEPDPWSDAQRERFLYEHQHWPAANLQEAEQMFVSLARQIGKWTDDCGLFVFGYLVRQFSERVLAEGKSEDEILIVSSFGSAINVVRRMR